MTAADWQTVAALTQTVVGGLAFGAAVWIGIRQARISQTQADIAKRQVEITEELSFAVMAEIAFKREGLEQLQIHNKGAAPITLWGTQQGSAPNSMLAEPMLIMPGGLFYIPVAAQLAELEDYAEKNGRAEARIRFFVKNCKEVPYVVHSLFGCVREKDRVRAFVQTVSILRMKW